MGDQDRFEYEVTREQYEQEQESLRQDAGYRDFLDALESQDAKLRLQRVTEMPLMSKDTGGGDFKLVPEGTHIAVCDMVIDLGLQPSSYGPKHKVYIRWQLPHERAEWTKDGVAHSGPMTIGNFYTNSLSTKANLRSDLEGWRGRAFTQDELKGFDLFTVLGVPCQVSVTHDATGPKTYANVTGVVGMPKGMPRPEVEGELLKYSADEPGTYDKLPEWLRKKIDAQVAEDDVPPAPEAPGFDDDIPF